MPKRDMLHCPKTQQLETRAKWWCVAVRESEKMLGRYMVKLRQCVCVCWCVWSPRSLHLVSESFARLARRKAALSFISNTQSLTISANMEGQSLWRASPLRLVSEALCTRSWRYSSTMVVRSDDSKLPSCGENKITTFCVLLYLLASKSSVTSAQNGSYLWAFGTTVSAGVVEQRSTQAFPQQLSVVS